MQEQEQKRGCVRACLRWAFRVVVVVVLLIAAAFLIVFHTALYNRFYLFPRQATAWEEMRKHRVPVALQDGWTEYRGVCHSHSELSHDSKIGFPDILAALKKADVNFICMTDHPEDNKADYSRGWKGINDGILFIRGYEMNLKDGFMPWGLPDATVLNPGEDPASLAKKIHDAGGVVFFAHCEEKRHWELPEVTGMEIYNIHVDFNTALDKHLANIAANVLLNLRQYPDQTMRLIFERPDRFLQRWDDVNRTHKFVGIAGNDCHQNTGVRGFYTANDTIVFKDTGHVDLKLAEIKLNAVTRWIMGRLYGPIVPGRQFFRLDLDPYERMVRYVNTHVLAKDLTEASLIDALRQGRVFVAFDMIADARGFKFIAQGAQKKATLGETIALEPGLKLCVGSPVACRFTLVRDGKPIERRFGTGWEFQAPGPGKYRIEAELNILDEWTPWVYTNPIEIL